MCSATYMIEWITFGALGIAYLKVQGRILIFLQLTKEMPVRDVISDVKPTIAFIAKPTNGEATSIGSRLSGNQSALTYKQC